MKEATCNIDDKTEIFQSQYITGKDNETILRNGFKIAGLNRFNEIFSLLQHLTRKQFLEDQGKNKTELKQININRHIDKAFYKRNNRGLNQSSKQPSMFVVEVHAFLI